MMAESDAARLRSYDDITTRVWRDRRCTPGTRELLLAIAWVLARDPDYAGRSMPDAERGGYLWRQMAAMLGRDGRRGPRYKQILADDAPRYEPANTWPDRFCEAPRIRQFRPRDSGSGIVSATCLIGRHPHLGECRHTVFHSAASAAGMPKSVPEASATCDASPKSDFHLVERDPLTGWHIDHWFCARHRDHFERVKAQLAGAPAAPEPIPNAGGILPCFFKADWTRLYTQVRPGWTVPSYGVAADDWPGAISGGVTPRRPGLRLILGELADA